ncbi:MAG: OsmC family protein [Haloferacaceae archaeon]
MADVISSSVDGYRVENDFDGGTLVVDPEDESTPSPVENLLASYGSCFLAALRIAAMQRGVDDLGRVDVVVDSEMDDHLSSIAFEIRVEAALDEEAADAVLDRATDLCHVHHAVRDGLRADLELVTDAF